MKRVGNLYNQITDLKNIKEMYDKKVSINTKNKIKIEKFDEYYTSNLVRIKKILESKNYEPGKYNIFLIKEPKVRLIMSQSITDKIINHLVSKYFLVDVFEPMLIENNIATRINKGTHVGIRKVKETLNKNINKDLYILKFDIKKHFFNIDHKILKNIIRKNNKLIVKVKNQTKRRFKRQIKSLYKLYANNMLDLEKIKQVKVSYLGHLKYGNTKKLAFNTINRYKKDRYNLGNKVIIDKKQVIIINNR